jgi:hypothetical protein
MKQKLYNLIRKIWNDELMDWEEGIIYTTYEKGYKSVCSNYRGITFLNVTYKKLTSLLHNSFISNLSYDRSTASSKTIPPLNAI